MTDRKFEIGTAMDASGVRQGAKEVEDRIGQMSRKVLDESAKAGQGIDGIGDKASETAQKLSKSERSIVASIQRATAAAEAGGRQTAAYFDAIAQQRGVSADTLRPYLDQLRRAEDAQRAASASLGSMGMSARETTAALRQVPMQFTDIVTSLSAGQSPLQVFLQQGGQLKDTFGGVGAAAQALGGYVVGLINPFTLAGAAALTLAVGMFKGRQEASGYVEALVMTGNAAGVTADQLADMAQALDGVSGTQAKAAEVLTRLASSGEVGASSLERYAKAAIDLERAGGPAAEKTADAFAELGRKPLEAVLKLNEAQRFLTAAQFEQIKALADTGRETEAARVAQEAYAAAIEQRTPQLVERLGLVERAWIGIKDAVKQTGDAILSVGRADTLQQRIGALEALRDRMTVPGGGYGSEGAAMGLELQRLDAQIAALKEQERLSGRAATVAAERTRQEEARIKWIQEGNRFLTERQRLDKEEERIRNEGLAAGIKQEEIQQRIAILRERAGKGDAGKAATEAERQASLLSQLSGLTSTYTQDLARLDAMRVKGLISEERYGELLRQLVFSQPVVKKGQEDMAKAIEAEARATADAVKAREQYVQGLDRQNEAGQRTVDQLADELIGMVAGKEVLRQRVELRLQEQIAALEVQAIELEERDSDSKAAAAIRDRMRLLREEIALRRGIATATEDAEVARASERSAQKLADEYQRASDQISQSLTDAIMQGGQSAGDLLKNYFRTLVLRPIVQAIVNPVAGYVQDALGYVVGGGGQGAGLARGASSFLGNGMVGAGVNYASVYSGAAYGTGFGTQQSAMLAAQEAGMTSAAGASSAASAAGWAALVVAALKRGSSEYDMGWTREAARAGKDEIFGGDPLGRSFKNLTVDNLLSSLGRRLGMSDKWADILSGSTAIAQLIGRQAPKVTAQGVTGTLGGAGGMDLSTFQDWVAKGGWFRRDKRGTQVGELSDDMSTAFGQQAQGLRDAAAEYGKVLGLPTAALSSVTSAFRVQFTGDAEADQKAVEAEFQKYQAALFAGFADAVKPFRKVGEDVTTTVRRLAGLEVFSREINDLGGVFRQVARLGFDARESIIAMAGGMEEFQSKAASFVQAFYSRDEIAGIKARDVQTQLLELGLGTGVNTKADFRAAVEGTDVSTEAGRRQLAQLLDLAGPFADVASYLEETGLTLLEAARQAPAAGVLTPAFEAAGREQVDAINAGTRETGRVVERLDQLIELQRELRSRMGVPGMPEAGLAP